MQLFFLTFFFVKLVGEILLLIIPCRVTIWSVTCLQCNSPYITCIFKKICIHSNTYIEILKNHSPKKPWIESDTFKHGDDLHTAFYQMNKNLCSLWSRWILNMGTIPARDALCMIFPANCLHPYLGSPRRHPARSLAAGWFVYPSVEYTSAGQEK